MDNNQPVATSKRRRKASVSLPEILYVSPTPHIKKLDTVRSIMLDVIIALIPAICWGVYIYGNNALNILIVSVLTAVICEACALLVRRKSICRITDLSAVVTGLIVGLMLPSGVELWVPAVGSAFAIVIVKQFFGGIGMNIVNPAVAARVFLLLCWPDQMVRYTNKLGDAMSGATPLVVMKTGDTPEISLFHLVLGDCAGAIGEVSAVALAAGFIYLLVRKVISIHIPLAFIGTVVVISLLAPQTGEITAVYYQLLAGSLLFTAIFCAGDMTTTPVTGSGKFIFGFGCGLITVFIRYFGAYPDGTSYAILIMNLLVPLIDKFTRPDVFGGKNEKKQ